VFKVTTTNNFEKDVARCVRRGYNLILLEKAVKHLELEGALPKIYKPHILSGRLNGYWECHIKPNWLLIWSMDDVKKTIVLVGTGTHSDLF